MPGCFHENQASAAAVASRSRGHAVSGKYVRRYTASAVVMQLQALPRPEALATLGEDGGMRNLQ